MAQPLSKDNATFEAWMARLDNTLGMHLGIDTNDLEDRCYRDMYDSGETSLSVVREIMAEMSGDC